MNGLSAVRMIEGNSEKGSERQPGKAKSADMAERSSFSELP